MTPARYSNLVSPPRPVPMGVRCLLLSNVAAMFGGIFFLVGCVFTAIFGGATAPLSGMRLSMSHLETGGRLVGVVKTNFSEGGGEDSPGTPIYRCDFTFRLTDGREFKGRSFTLGHRYTAPANVTIEYYPGDPTISRIRGTRIAPFPPWALFVLVFPIVGLAVLVTSLAHGYRKIRLLRNGLYAEATIKGIQSQNAPAAPEMTPTEFRAAAKQQLAMMSETLKQSGAQKFPAYWRMAVIAFLIFGNLFMVVWIVAAASSSAANKTFMIGFGIGFAVLWNLMCFFFLKVGRRMNRTIAGNTTPDDEKKMSANVTVRFTFQSRDGKTIEATDSAMFSSRIGDEPTEPILYDPKNPSRALLLDGLSVPVRPSRLGGWDAPVGFLPYLRALFVLVCLAAPVIGWLVADLMK